MNNPGEGSDQTPVQSGRGSNSRNTGSQNTGEGFSSGGGGNPVAGQEAESSRTRISGVGLYGHIIQGSGTGAAGGGGGGTSSSMFSSGVGIGGVGAEVLRIGGDSGVFAQRKRTREGDVGAGPSRTVQVNSPPPSPPPPPPPPVEGQPFLCTICTREFRTDRGLCGHMRSHADRPWRGAFPPPVFNRDEFYEAGVGHLLNRPAEDAGHRAEESGALAGQGDAAAEMPGRQRDSTAAVSEASGGERQILPDLNETPPRDEHGNYI
ncbi:hypothetical protein U1Q18_011485 [Sarracenia purpurea var. burkii]